MSTLYRYEVMGLDGSPWLNQGEPITVDGSPMVRLTHGAIVPAVGFHATKEAASRAAADRMEVLMKPVMSRIAQMRGEVTT